MEYYLQMIKKICKESPQSPQQSKAAISIQKWVRGYQTRLRVFQLAKQAQYRKRVLQQIMETEQNYIGDLGFINSDFKMKLVSQKVITIAQSKVIFSNVEEIRKLNQEFYASVYTHYSKYTHYKCIFSEAHKFVYFFKIYFQYFNNFPNACALVQELRKNIPLFRQFLDQLYHDKKFRSLRLEDFIVKPIQRLPKYVILFKQLKKRTPNDHPDYLNICNLLSAFQQVNTSNNEKLNKMINNYKLAEIQDTLALRDVASPGVDFIGQEPVTVLTYDNKTVDSILYLLSNQLILKKARTNRLLVRVMITNGASLIQDQSQMYYKNILTVQNHDGDSFTLLCLTTQQKVALFNKLSFLIFSAQKSIIEKAMVLFKSNGMSDSFAKKLNLLELMPDVTVLGTSERESRILKYTVYIIQIKIKNVKQKVFLRFSEVLEIQRLIQFQFPQVQIKQNLLSTTWFLNHKPRTIQQRKMNIQRFLKQILSKEEIMIKGHNILVKIGLPYDFYDLPRKFKENYDHSRSSQMSRILKSSQKSRKKSNRTVTGRYSLYREIQEAQKQENIQEKSISIENYNLNINDLLKFNQNQLGHFTRLSQIMDSSTMQKNIRDLQLEIYIPCIQSQQGYKIILVQMKSVQRVQHLICFCARKIGLNYFKDFRLFLERNYVERVLDDDEIVGKVNEEMKQGQYRIVLKKMIYISKQAEERELRKDQIRLKIIASQTIYDAYRGRYALKYQKYLIFACLIGIILKQNGHSFKRLPTITKDMLVPKQTLIDEIQQWNEDFNIMFQQIQQKLLRIQKQNKKVNLIKQSEETLDDLTILAYYSIIKELEQNILQGTYPFMVQLNEEFHQYLMDIHNIESQNRNVWFAIKHTSVTIVSMCMSIKYFQFQHSEIAKTETFPGYIAISLKKGISVKLKTTSSYFIRQLLVYYNNYRVVWERATKDVLFRAETIDQQQRQKDYDNIYVQ